MTVIINKMLNRGVKSPFYLKKHLKPITSYDRIFGTDYEEPP
jgi:hypothetical protein